MPEIDFELVPEERTKVEKAKRGSKYDPIIDDFIKSKETSVRVETGDIEPTTLTIGLRNRVKTRELNITVSQRGNKVYLLKEEK